MRTKRHERVSWIAYFLLSMWSVQVHAKYEDNRFPAGTRLLPLITTIRGGKKPSNQPIYEMNQGYVPPPGSTATTTTTSFFTERTFRDDYSHEAWLEAQENEAATWANLQTPQQQQQQQHQRGIRISSDVPFSKRIQAYISHLQRTSPALFVTSASCMVVFCLWQIPQFQPILERFFVCRRNNLHLDRIVSVVLSSISHASFLHIVFNLYALLSLGPTVQNVLASAQWPLWPLLLGAAIVGNVSFLVLSPGSGGGCFGLSGVTLSLVAMFAQEYPERELRMMIMGIIPVRMPAKFLLRGLLAWSVLFSLTNRLGVAHQAHLGGILFGAFYHELWVRRRELRPVLRKLQRFTGGGRGVRRHFKSPLF